MLASSWNSPSVIQTSPGGQIGADFKYMLDSWGVVAGDDGGG